MPARSLELGDEPDTLSAASPDPGPWADRAPCAIHHPRFELLGALGRGAFGTVFADLLRAVELTDFDARLGLAFLSDDRVAMGGSKGLSILDLGL